MTDTFTSGRFIGRTIIVTGAGSGIGRATALRLLREGARVIATDVIAERLDSLTEDADGELVDGELLTYCGDVSAEETANALVTACAGRIDGLANVAGVMDGFLPPAEMVDSVWERVMNVNVTAIMRSNVPALASAEQLAASITWLLSDDSLNVSGAVLANDGGWAAI